MARPSTKPSQSKSPYCKSQNPFHTSNINRFQRQPNCSKSWSSDTRKMVLLQSYPPCLVAFGNIRCRRLLAQRLINYGTLYCYILVESLRMAKTSSCKHSRALLRFSKTNDGSADGHSNNSSILQPIRTKDQLRVQHNDHGNSSTSDPA